MSDDRGTYLVRLIPERSTPVRIGRLGTLILDGGEWLYVGSALGLGGLAARCRHHEHRAARPHWHLDYLRPYCQVPGCWVVRGLERREHDWARRLGTLPGASWPLARFGASDCDCPAHLIRLEQTPETATLSAWLGVSLTWRAVRDPFEESEP